MKDKIKKLAILDIDGLFYHCSKETIAISIQEFDDRFNHILEQTEAAHYIAFCSFKPYFRHDIDPAYKEARKQYGSPLKWLKTIKAYAIERYGIQWMRGVEADDLCAYWMNKKEYEVSSTPTLWGSFDKILCTPDKDLLKSTEGKHFNYTFKLTDEAKDKKKANTEYVIQDEDSIKGWWVETTKEQADTFIWLQMLMGDSADGITGIPKVGIKTAEKYLNEIYEVNSDTVTIQNWVFDAYINYYGITEGIYQFQKNYRLLYLLKNDNDFIRELGKIPKFPNILPVIKEKEINVEF